MRVLDRGDQLRKEFDAARTAGCTVGLVPTMGYLHQGHASLIRRSAADCDLTAVTVFVNPLQFAPSDDLDAYPADLDHDVEVAAAAGASLVFAPSVEEMYPGGPPAVTVHVSGPLVEGMEAASRPGHFDAVATVVTKLFNVAGPCRAYFGEKDWQQLQVVRRLVADLSFPVAVEACSTVREPDGLACSSRNVRLSAEERVAATVLHRALLAGADEGDPALARQRMVAVVEAEPLAILDYAEVRPDRLLIAARIGDVRLIDNIHIDPRETPCAAA